MADKLVTLQDENKTPIYPESRASVVKTSDGTTVEDALARKQPSGNYATKEELSNYATTEALAQGLKGKADTTSIPTKLSQLTNDSNYLSDAPSDGKQYGRMDGAWSVIEAGGTQYLDLSMFSENSGTLSEEDYQKVVKAYEDGVTAGLASGMIVVYITIIEMDGSYIMIGNFVTPEETGKSMNTIIQIHILNDKTYISNSFYYRIDTTGAGTKALTDNGQYAEFAKPTKVESGGSGTVTKQINPNTFYKFGECASLTITLAAGGAGLENEYKFEFVSGSTPTTLSLPDSVKWSGGNAPTIEASKTYQISIVNNLAVYAAF